MSALARPLYVLPDDLQVRRGAQAWGAPAQAAAPCPARHDVAPGRLEPRVGPRSMVGPDRHHGRCDQRYLLGLLRRRRGHHVELPGGGSEAIRAKGLFCSLYADRASHYWNTPEAGGKVDKDTPTQVGRALAQLGIELIPAYSPEARGRSERMFGPCRSACPRNSGFTDMVEANRFLKEVFLPTPASRPRPRTGAPPSSPLTTSCASTRNAPSQTTTRCGAPGTSDPRRPPPPPLRQGQGPRPRIPRRHKPSSMDRDVWRDTTPIGQPIDSQTREAA